MEEFFGLTLSRLEAQIGALGKEKYRARQLFRWVYNQGNLDFREMTNIPKSLRSVFSEMFSLDTMPIAEQKPSRDGSTKLALVTRTRTSSKSSSCRKSRVTLCLTQIGCRMGCRFCVTEEWLQRNQRGGDSGQVITVGIPEEGRKSPVSNIVFMGMGEPADNIDNVATALDILKDQERPRPFLPQIFFPPSDLSMGSRRSARSPPLSPSPSMQRTTTPGPC